MDVSSAANNGFSILRNIKKYEGVDDVLVRFKQYEDVKESGIGQLPGIAVNMVNYVRNVGLQYDAYMDGEAVSEMSGLLVYTMYGPGTSVGDKARGLNLFGEIFSVFLQDHSVHQRLLDARLAVLRGDKNAGAIDLFTDTQLDTIVSEMRKDGYIEERFHLMDLLKCRIFLTVLKEKFGDKKWAKKILENNNSGDLTLRYEKLVSDARKAENDDSIFSSDRNIDNVVVRETERRFADDAVVRGLIKDIIRNAWQQVISNKQGLQAFDHSVVHIDTGMKGVTPEMVAKYYAFRDIEILSWQRDDATRGKALARVNKFLDDHYPKAPSKDKSSEYDRVLYVRALTFKAKLNLWLAGTSDYMRHPFESRAESAEKKTRYLQNAIDTSKKIKNTWEWYWNDKMNSMKKRGRVDTDSIAYQELFSPSYFNADRISTYLDASYILAEAYKSLGQRNVVLEGDVLNESNLDRYEWFIDVMSLGKENGGNDTLLDEVQNRAAGASGGMEKMPDLIADGFISGFMWRSGNSRISPIRTRNRYRLAMAEIMNAKNPKKYHDKIVGDNGAYHYVKNNIRSADLNYTQERLDAITNGHKDRNVAYLKKIEYFRGSWLELYFRNILLYAWHQASMKDYEPMHLLLAAIRTGKNPVAKDHPLYYELNRVCQYPDGMRYLLKCEDEPSFKVLQAKLLYWEKDYEGAVALLESVVNDAKTVKSLRPEIVVDLVPLLLQVYMAKGEEDIWKAQKIAQAVLDKDSSYMIGSFTIGTYRDKAFISTDGEGAYALPDVYQDQMLLLASQINNYVERMYELSPEDLRKMGTKNYLAEQNRLTADAVSYGDSVSLDHTLVLREEYIMQKRLLIDKDLISGDNKLQLARSAQGEVRKKYLDEAEKAYRKVLANKRYQDPDDLYLYADGIARVSMGFIEIARLRGNVDMLLGLCDDFLSIEKQAEAGKNYEIPESLRKLGVTDPLIVRSLITMNFGLRSQQVLASHYKELGNFTLARQYYKNIVARYTDHAQTVDRVRERELLSAYGSAIMALADIAVAEGNLDGAILLLEQHITSDKLADFRGSAYREKVYYEVRLRLAGLYKDAGDWDTAEAYLTEIEDVIKKGSASTDGVSRFRQYMFAQLQDSVTITRGWLYVDQKKYALARAEFQKVSDRYSGYKDVLDQWSFAYADAQKGLVIAAQNQGDLVAAGKYCSALNIWVEGQPKQIILESGRDGMLPYRRGGELVTAQLLVSEKKYRKAQELFEKVIMSSAHWIDPGTRTAIQFNENVTFADKLLVMQALEGLADMYVKLGDVDNALAVYDGLLAMKKTAENDTSGTESGIRSYVMAHSSAWYIAKARVESSLKDFKAARTDLASASDLYVQNAKKKVSGVKKSKGSKDLIVADKNKYLTAIEFQARHDGQMLRADMYKQQGVYVATHNELKAADARIGEAELLRDVTYGTYQAEAVAMLRAWSLFSQGRYTEARAVYVQILKDHGITELTRTGLASFKIDPDDGMDEENIIIDALKGLAVLDTYAGDAAQASFLWNELAGLAERYTSACLAGGHAPYTGIVAQLTDLQQEAVFNERHVAFQQENYQRAFSGYAEVMNTWFERSTDRDPDLASQTELVETMFRMAQVYKNQGDGAMALAICKDIENYIATTAAQKILTAQYADRLNGLRVEVYVVQRRFYDLYAVTPTEFETAALGTCRADLVNDRLSLTVKGRTYSGTTADEVLELVQKDMSLTPDDRSRIRNAFEQAVVCRYKGLDRMIEESERIYAARENELTFEEKKSRVYFQIARADREMQIAATLPETDVAARREHAQKALVAYRKALELADTVSDARDDDKEKLAAVGLSSLIIRRIAAAYSESGDTNKALALYRYLAPKVFSGLPEASGDAAWNRECGKARQIAKFNTAHLNEDAVTETERAAMMLEVGSICSRRMVVDPASHFPIKDYATSAEYMLVFLEHKYGIKPDAGAPLQDRVLVVMGCVKKDGAPDRKVKQALFMLALGFVYDRDSANDDAAARVLSFLEDEVVDGSSAYDLESVLSGAAEDTLPIASGTPAFPDLSFMCDIAFLVGADHLYKREQLSAIRLFSEIESMLSRGIDHAEKADDPYQRNYYETVRVRARLESARAFFSASGIWDNYINADDLYTYVIYAGGKTGSLDAQDLDAQARDMLLEQKEQHYRRADKMQQSEALRSYRRYALLELPQTIDVATAASQGWSYERSREINGVLEKYAGQLQNDDERALIELNGINNALLEKRSNSNAAIDYGALKQRTMAVIMRYISKRINDKITGLRMSGSADAEEKIAEIEKRWAAVEQKGTFSYDDLKAFLLYADEEVGRDDLLLDERGLNVLANAFYVLGNIIQSENDGYGKYRGAWESWYRLTIMINPRHLGARKKLRIK